MNLPIKPIPRVPQKIRPSKWGDHVRVHPRLLPLQFGDGRQDVILSFYHAPEIEVLVKFDSSLPLDLPAPERFELYEGKRSFRDYLDEIYEACKETHQHPAFLGQHHRKRFNLVSRMKDWAFWIAEQSEIPSQQSPVNNRLTR